MVFVLVGGCLGFTVSAGSTTLYSPSERGREKLSDDESRDIVTSYVTGFRCQYASIQTENLDGGRSTGCDNVKGFVTDPPLLPLPE